jgi:hypothetical protein
LVEVPYPHYAIFVTAYQETLMPIEGHHCLFVGTDELHAVCSGTEVPYDHCGIVGGADTNPLIAHNFTDAPTA